jgi:putative transposase
LPSSAADKRLWIEPGHGELSIAAQCELLGLPRSSYYYEPVPESVANLRLMRLIDEQYLATPFYGSRRMTHCLIRAGHDVNRKRVQRLMQIMGLEGLFPGRASRKTTLRAPDHKVYPYLLRGLTVDRPNQVWCSDITYVPLRHGFLYLVAVMDWYSRHVLAWRLSNTLDAAFCVEAAAAALAGSRPEVFNTDQGCQFTSAAFTSLLLQHQVAISMDGRGRAMDNVFIERLWRSLKYEEIYLKDHATGADLCNGLTDWFELYTHRRPHQALQYRTPFEVYHGLEPARPTPRTSQHQRPQSRRRVSQFSLP